MTFPAIGVRVSTANQDVRNSPRHATSELASLARSPAEESGTVAGPNRPKRPARSPRPAHSPHLRPVMPFACRYHAAAGNAAAHLLLKGCCQPGWFVKVDSSLSKWAGAHFVSGVRVNADARLIRPPGGIVSDGLHIEERLT